MIKAWPDITGCLCARMSRGFNGQDAMGLITVVCESDDEVLLRGERSVVQYHDVGACEHAELYA